MPGANHQILAPRLPRSGHGAPCSARSPEQRISLERPGDAAKADAAAARIRRPRAKPAAAPGAAPEDQLHLRDPGPQPGGVVREYWIQAQDDALGHRARPTATSGTVRPSPAPSKFTAFGYQPMTAGFAAPLAPPQIPGSRAHRGGRRRHRRALPQRREPQGAPGAHHASARREVQPRVRRRLPRRLHPRGRLRRPRRGVHLHVGGDARTAWASGLTTTTAPTTRSTPSAACSARSSSARRARRPPTTSTCCSSTRCRPASPASRSRSSASTGAPTPATPDAHREGRARTSAIHVIGMDDNFHDFHIHGHRWRDPSGTFVDTPAVGPERDGHRAVRGGQPWPLAVPLPRLLPPGRRDGGLVPGRTLIGED